jgi:ATP-dependent Lon protease
MRDFRDAKAMAQTLRDTLKTKSVSLTHSESLEIVAKTLGFHDWNVLSATIQARKPADAEPPKTPSQSGIGAVLPVIPLRDIVLFPQMVVPLFVGREKTKRAVENALATDAPLLVVTQRRDGDDDPDLGDLYTIGVTAKVIQRLPLNDGTLKITVSGLRRAAIARPVEGEFLAAETATIDDVRDEATAETMALSREIVEKYQAHAKNPLLRFLEHLIGPGMLADTVAPMLQTMVFPGTDRMQDILETTDVVKRLEMVLALIKTDRQAA